MKKSLLTILVLLNCILIYAQNVGIGINNPTRARLEVNGGPVTSAIFGGDGSGISLYRNSPGIGFNNFLRNNYYALSDGYGAKQTYLSAYGDLIIDNFANTSAGSIPPNQRKSFLLSKYGRATIACDAFGATLNVGRFLGLNPTANFSGSAHSSIFYLGTEENTYIRAGKDNGTVYINDIPGGKIVLSGSVGINTATPAGALEVRQLASGLCFALIEPVNLNKWEYRLSSSTGDLRMLVNNVYVSRYDATNGNYIIVSDRRLKNAVESLYPVLQKIKQLVPVEYYMIGDSAMQTKTIGFIAQEVKKLFPQMVTVHNKPLKGYATINDLHTMDYSGINVIAVQAIKEQQEIIESQAKVLQELEAELELLEKMITTSLQK